MFSVIKPSIVYRDVSTDITEHDVDAVSDLWEMDGRSVYRGTRDPRYTHANVFWLYDEDLPRVGCVVHELKDHAEFDLLWFRESCFGTLLQEDWTVGNEIWYSLPRNVFERCINEGWTSPSALLEHCLRGNVRIVTMDMLVNLPIVHECKKCNMRTLKPRDCTTPIGEIDFPDKQKIFFIDDDMIVHQPPENSCVWSKLQLRDDDSLQVQEQVEGYSQERASSPPPPGAPPPSPQLQPLGVQAP